MRKKPVVQAYLSSILAHRVTSVATLGSNCTEFKNKVFNEACNQLQIKRLFSKPFHQQENARVENVHVFLNQAFTKFL